MPYVFVFKNAFYKRICQTDEYSRSTLKKTCLIPSWKHSFFISKTLYLCYSSYYKFLKRNIQTSFTMCMLSNSNVWSLFGSFNFRSKCPTEFLVLCVIASTGKNSINSVEYAEQGHVLVYRWSKCDMIVKSTLTRFVWDLGVWYTKILFVHFDLFCHLILFEYPFQKR